MDSSLPFESIVTTSCKSFNDEIDIDVANAFCDRLSIKQKELYDDSWRAIIDGIPTENVLPCMRIRYASLEREMRVECVKAQLVELIPKTNTEIEREEDVQLGHEAVLSAPQAVPLVDLPQINRISKLYNIASSTPLTRHQEKVEIMRHKTLDGLIDAIDHALWQVEFVIRSDLDATPEIKRLNKLINRFRKADNGDFPCAPCNGTCDSNGWCTC